MSLSDLERLRSVLASDLTLAGEFWGLEGGTARCSWAGERGYQVTGDEIAGLSEGELSDEDLDMVAGGWDGG